MPVNARFLISLRHVDFGAFVNAASAVAVMVYAAGRLDLSPTPGRNFAGFSPAPAGRAVGALLGDVPAGLHQFLDGAGAGHRLGLLQSVPAGAPAGRGVPGRVPQRCSPSPIPVLLVSNVPVKLLIDKLGSPG
jgi:hypothetical protein